MISDFHSNEISFVVSWLMLDINKTEEHSTTEVLVYIFQTTVQTETEYLIPENWIKFIKLRLFYLTYPPSLINTYQPLDESACEYD